MDASYANLGGLWGGQADQGASWNALTNNGQWQAPQVDASAPTSDQAGSPSPAESHGLLGHIANGLHSIIGGLLGPQGAQPGGAASGQQPQAQPQPQQAPQAQDMNALLKRIKPNWWDVTMEAGAEGQGRAAARQHLIDQRLNEAMLPYRVAAEQGSLAYGSSIQDPALRNLYFNNPAAYAEVMKQRLGQTKVDKDTTIYGAGPNGDQTYNGAVTLNQGQDLTNTAGAPIRHVPAAPIVAGPSTTTMSGDTGQPIATAPAEPKIVTTKPDEHTDIVYPGAPNAGGTGGAPVAPSAGGGPRGIRNNNPWNVSTLPQGSWNGQSGVDGQFAQFSTPQAGARAADINLQNYGRRDGINTVRGIVSRWAPKWQTETPTYVHDVSAALGVDPDKPLDIATNSQTRAKVLHAMLPIESGRAGAQQVAGAGAQAGASPAPSQGGSPNVQSIRQGAMPRDVPSEEAIAKGLAPGKWQQMPDGTYKQASSPPKDDLDKVARLRGAAKVMDELAGSDSRFMDAAGRTRPSPWLAGGDHKGLLGMPANPYAWYMEHNNPDVAQMESLHNQEIFQMKPDNAGQRIMATEIPIWGSSTVDPSKSLEANKGIVRDHQEAQAYMQKKAEFYENWLYDNGTLHGADQAWQKAAPKRGGATGAGSGTAVARGPQLPPRAPALPQSGFRIVQ